MSLINNSISFSIYDDQTRDDDILNQLAQLNRELWCDINYPHETYPIEYYKKRIQKRKNSTIKFVNILMKNTDDYPIGFATLNINIGKYNRTLCRSEYYIRPEYRRQGLFKKLFIESLKFLSDEVKVIQFFFRIDSNQPNFNQNNSLDKKFEELASVIGAKLSFVGRRSESDLTKQNLVLVTKKAQDLELKAKENGYSIVFVKNNNFESVSFTRAQYVKLLVELDNDMPRDDSIMEDHSFTEEDYVNAFTDSTDPGYNHWILIAVENESQLPIAMTETFFRLSNPNLAFVGDTGVKREHRGKRLGLILKTLMLERLLSDPLTKDRVRYWITFNAKSNSYMISINDQLGYIQSSLEHQWEVSIEKLKKYIETH